MIRTQTTIVQFDASMRRVARRLVRTPRLLPSDLTTALFAQKRPATTRYEPTIFLSPPRYRTVFSRSSLSPPKGFVTFFLTWIRCLNERLRLHAIRSLPASDVAKFYLQISTDNDHNLDDGGMRY